MDGDGVVDGDDDTDGILIVTVDRVVAEPVALPTLFVGDNDVLGE